MLFTKTEIEDGLRSLVTELVSTTTEVTLQIVGGAALMLQIDREVLTTDIDSLHSSSDLVQQAANKVAMQRNWPTTWLNDAVKMYASHHDSESDWDIYIVDHGVQVLLARPELLLAMKLYAGRGQRDAVDIDQLLDACQIKSVSAATKVFDRYYPNESMSKKAMAQLSSRFQGTN